MIMFALPSFCRVCLKYDKNLIDLAHIENEPNETLLSKLQLCVSEVEWDTFKPILCHPCIALLNIAFNFKKQCVQSADILKNYVELVNVQRSHYSESEYAQKTTDYFSNGSSKGNYVILPNQKVVKILVGGTQTPKPTYNYNNNNTFQNVFVNLVPPATNIIPINTNAVRSNSQNIFNSNKSTFQKLMPSSVANDHSMPNRNQSGLSINSNTMNELEAEEMSVEIDPISLLALEEEESELSSTEEDWDEVITQQKIETKQTQLKNINDANEKSFTSDCFGASGSHFLFGTSSSEQQLGPAEFICESCQKSYPTLKSLKQHYKYSHLGKLPFRCDFCNVDYLTRSDYEKCVKSHDNELSLRKTSMGLEDFANRTSKIENDLIVPADDLTANENGQFICSICHLEFTNSSGLLRHKMRKHEPCTKSRKKYFTKGQKNGSCDICKRDFSTITYMRLHRRLHFRSENGHKHKAYGKNKYNKNSSSNFDQQQQQQQQLKAKDNQNEPKKRKLRVKRITDIQNYNSKMEKQGTDGAGNYKKKKKEAKIKNKKKAMKNESKKKPNSIIINNVSCDENDGFCSADSDRLIIEEDL